MVARNRLVLSGSLGVIEAWSVSMHFAGEGGDIIEDAAGLNNWCAGVATVLDGLITNALGNFLSTAGTITQVDAYAYGATGPAIAVGQSPVVDVNGGASAQLPYQTCSVFTLRTGLAGASFRGRSYWPAIGAEVGSNGEFQGDTTPGQTASRFAGLLEGIADAALFTAPFRPVVYSPTRDLVTPVTSVEWDTVPDIQRRRADAITGTRTASPYPPA